VEDLKVKYESMTMAMDKLKRLDKNLYDIAAAKVDPRGLLLDDSEELRPLKGPARRFYLSRVQGLFPREMWVPTDTPKKDGWRHQWKAPPSSTKASSS